MKTLPETASPYPLAVRLTHEIQFLCDAYFLSMNLSEQTADFLRDPSCLVHEGRPRAEHSAHV